MPRIEELDARYLAGEAAPYSEAWSVVKESFDAYNRRERPPTMHDFTNADNRRGTAFQSGDMIAFMGATWADTPDVKLRIESVHRLRAGGAVVTWTGHGNSVEGFEAEWRAITFVTVHGGMITRSELFDETDLEAALARFDELSRPAPQLENTASKAHATDS